jgi:N-acetylneuraminic acid mutarotase
MKGSKPMARPVKKSLLSCGVVLATWGAGVHPSELPKLPRAIAGQFVGTAGDLLVVAGGSWWTAPPSQGGRKIWADEIHILAATDGEWRAAGRLPHPCAYGGAISLKDAVVFAGGQNGDAVSSEVRALRRRGGALEVENWPDMPVPSANLAVAMAAGQIYAFGGQSSAQATSASARLWSLKAGAGKSGHWVEHPPLPGEGRILAAAAGCRDTLYILGGAALTPSPAGGAARRYLREAWSFAPARGWERLPDLPAPSVAAPAVCGPSGEPVLLGGDDGSMAGVVLAQGEVHPGFGRSVLHYDRARRRWVESGRLPLGLVTSGAAWWNNSIVIPGGEDRPGHRSATVLRIELKKEED